MKKILLASLMLVTIQLHAETLDGAFFNVSSGSNLSLNISTTIPNYYYSSAGIKINSKEYGLAGVGTECTLASNGYCLFGVSDTNPVNISLVGEPGIVDFTLCLQANGPSNCQNYSVGFSSYLYVTNFTSVVSVCPVLSNGTFGTCQDSGQSAYINEAVAIALNDENTLAYVVDYGASKILVFPVNPANGTFGAPLQEFAFDFSYGGITFNASGNILYITNYNTSSVDLCTLNANGTINTCTESSLGAIIPDPVGITLNEAGTFAYIPDQDSGSNIVYVCAIGMDGDFTSCISSGVTFDDPTTVALNEDQTIAYVTNYGGSYVSVCLINPADGTFSSCENSVFDTLDAPWGIVRNDTANLIYVSSGSNIGVCSVDLVSCDLIGDATFGFTVGLFISY